MLLVSIHRPHAHLLCVLHTSESWLLGNLPDATKLDARRDGSKFILTVTGTGDSLAETGQQFAWLGAALRSSRFESGVAICSPVIRISQFRDTASPNESRIESVIDVFCRIEYKIGEPTSLAEGPSGQCWHNMLKNPVLVTGYPIVSKHEHGLGLEIPLNMIARLGGSQRADEFDAKVYIKGFSTMLIATKIAGDLLIWHYFHNSKGERISYLDHTLQTVENISLLQLDKYRHVVGWSAKCVYYAGKCDLLNLSGYLLMPNRSCRCAI